MAQGAGGSSSVAGQRRWLNEAVVLNMEEFGPPPWSRKRTTLYTIGGAAYGFYALITRTWTRKEQRVLIYNYSPYYPMLEHWEVATTVDETSDFYKGEGFLDMGNLAYELRHTFRSIRSSVFRVRVTVSANYTDAMGNEQTATFTVRSRAWYPEWIKATDTVRKEYYERYRKTGAYYTEREVDPTTGRVVSRFAKRGRRRRRQARAVPQNAENPPDLFWLIAYAVWYAMEKCINELQLQGRSYLERLTFVTYTINEIVVVQEAIHE